MTRIPGVENKDAGPLARVLYFLTRRRLGHVITPIRLYAHHPRLLRAYAHMEMGQDAARAVAPTLKTLAGVEVARRIGCPF
jgi:hypothetical protein